MSHRKLYEEHTTLTRGELAAELHRLANRLETGRDLDYGTGDAEITLTVPHQIHREFEIKPSKNGTTMKVDIEFQWPVSPDGQVR
ncbi:amphi-Trp domain-containing protein [Nocardia pseudobrasiliensis]|uniref:Amphi-Trp domain-containing protein n=1 Tax=Nocardia pseudobrasiliensis TaxID=45979 RepID=A0A370HU59_9NOCA|nr:amphi-Trp domain-containing protein [Nocardia pseudobrasiliensis]RDI60494.1 amphi-Trp domain-containing protein [Nocardia pseudobrasiliensis]